ncbi:NADH-quinone oxidoreductase subunit NuoN [uncultured Nocardioides sp.]|uniref:NADH-quinone oxidoreductase subunit N n=1 Tax=uncultured Nocardioides sp. TaxID=198441 RepID=A0A6J4NA75_9ACTN|nr:NADH-quinone oxidoreductase subunit NuoN [uncultured Nocardioides sp.]CAA9378486.1 MAG: NADH-ubiquinone oxidoreductase chain N [uncultured Nocardioides sp.]
MNEFVKPVVDYFELSPLLIVFFAACLGVVVEAFVPRAHRYLVQTLLTVGALVGALVMLVLVAREVPSYADGQARGILAMSGTLALDGPTLFLWGLILVLAILGALLFAERHLDGGVSAFAGQAAALPGTDAERTASTRGLDHTEVYPLLLFAVFGMLLFPASNDLLTMFVALEILSLPLYLLTGLARRRRLLSQEAALKYFLLGAFSSGFFLYGAALIYGFSGSMQFSQISEAVRNDVDNRVMLLVGLGLLAVGLLFKVGAVPFQAWTPDVYQGAPTPVTAFMSAGTKVAAFGAILRLFYVAFGADRWSWQPMLWIIAILTMVLGAVLALTQTDIKRLLAYSSVAHTGFILTGVLGVQASGDLSNGEISSLQAVLFYLATYGLMTLGAFAVVGLVRDSAGEATTLSRWAGLGKEAPVVAGVFAFFLLAMAGIPLTSGFVGKWAVFSVALAAGAWPVVVAAIASSIIAVYLYVRVIVLMYFDEPIGEGPSVVRPSVLTATAIAVGAAATLMLGVLPGPLLDLAARAGEFIR